ncbi:MAG: hypothetical protein ACOYOU_05845 [Kiritimatiellia bacterium]
MKTILRYPLCALLILLLAAGCAMPKYAPPRYEAAQNRFGSIELVTTNRVYVCATIDSLTPENRDWLAPSFTPWEYVTDAVEKELMASGVTPIRAPLTFGPGFDDLQRTLAQKANQSEQAVYLGTELLWLSPHRWTLDARLFAPSGAVLFQKRGICMILGSGQDNLREAAIINAPVQPQNQNQNSFFAPVDDDSPTNQAAYVQEVTHMTLRQILADPKFKEALQK